MLQSEGVRATMSAEAPWWHSESDPRHSRLVKLVIVALFPALLLAVHQPLKLIVYGLAWLLPANTLWARYFVWCAMVVEVVLSLLGAFWICRLIWPTTRNESQS